ncbi:MAG TPA: TlyA family RNA methyltransferase [Candidatus Hydrogenedentes bacterium]|nr:TlyA family RNA methyltransferase [Candidatus Hydrogenedentota bacterium]HOV59754.1 TlyA family RNA methyltransferase [Candidatus Hydrogenedentota bacterium]
MGAERLDILVQKRFGLTRARAQALVREGRVMDDSGQVLDKPGARVSEGISLRLREGPRYVSRGGEKLEAAFTAFSLDVTGKVCLDVGASTGGFTDCLLAHGARLVHAVDVGYGQLDWKLRQDSRVIVLERRNIRFLESSDLREPPEFFTVDCSFISLRLVLPAVRKLVTPAAQGVVLIKPQFEAGREKVGRGGVVRDPAVHETVIDAVRQCARNHGYAGFDVIPSPLLGPAGNREFLAWLYPLLDNPARDHQ